MAEHALIAFVFHVPIVTICLLECVVTYFNSLQPLTIYAKTPFSQNAPSKLLDRVLSTPLHIQNPANLYFKIVSKFYICVTEYQKFYIFRGFNSYA